MHAPLKTELKVSPRDLLVEEVRLCFGVATACLLIGVAGWSANHMGALKTPLSSLMVVGAFYGIMGLARAWKLARWKATDLADEDLDD